MNLDRTLASFYASSPAGKPSCWTPNCHNRCGNAFSCHEQRMSGHRAVIAGPVVLLIIMIALGVFLAK